MELATPNNLDAEQSLIGSILIENESFFEVDGYLLPEMFYFDIHKDIYSAIKQLFNVKSKVDLVILTNHLRQDELIDKIGGPVYLIKLINSVPTSKNIDYYGKIILKAYQLREIISLSRKLQSECFENQEPIDIISNYQTKINHLLTHSIKKDFVHVKDLINPCMDSFEQMMNGEIKFGMPTGFIDLDKKFLIREEELIIIAARPGIGKTSLALNIAYNVSQKDKITGMFSIEMSKELLVNRLIASVGEIPLGQLSTGLKADHYWKYLTKAIQKLTETNILIDDSDCITVSEIRSKAIKLKKEKGCDLLIVDYLGLIRGKSKEGRRELVAQNVREIKSIARELKTPIILLAQLNREVEGRQSLEPKLSDLKETGEIEQTADVVIFISREKANSAEAKIIIAKQRNGGTGYVEMLYRPELTKFYSKEKIKIDLDRKDIHG